MRLYLEFVPSLKELLETWDLSMVGWEAYRCFEQNVQSEAYLLWLRQLAAACIEWY